jgi:FkbM family methyltransferase
MQFTIISYCCGTYPNIGGVPRYDTQLQIIFPNRVFFVGPHQKTQMLEFVKTCKNPIIITDNHLSCDIPNQYPVLLVHHGSALTHAEREPSWDPYWKNLCCTGQKIMLKYRNPINTWIISSSSFCTDEFSKFFGSMYNIFKNHLILHSSELNESLFKSQFKNTKPVILGNWSTNNKGASLINLLKQNQSFQFRQLNVMPSPNESLQSFNKRKQEIYLSSDIFLQLSVSEGNSYATLDALMCGLVVVASNVGLFYKDCDTSSSISNSVLQLENLECFVKIDWQRNGDVDYVLERLQYGWENREILSKNARLWYMNNCRFIDWELKMKKIVNDFGEYNYNNKLIKLGTEYGGWIVPTYMNLNENSVVYSIGVGEDISFDLLLWIKTKCNIVLIDPTIRAVKYFQEIQLYFADDEQYKKKFEKTYLKEINFKPDFLKFKYLEKAIWNKRDKLKFYKQSNPEYVSQSLIENMFTDEYYEVDTITLNEVMSSLNHNRIDLLKMDIEGAEVAVLENMLDNKIYPTYLLVEFDLKLKNKDLNGSTEKIIKKLMEVGYKIIANENLNITFMKIT